MKLSPYFVNQYMMKMSDTIRESLIAHGPELANLDRLALAVDHWVPKNSIKRQDSILGIILIIRLVII